MLTSQSESNQIADGVLLEVASTSFESAREELHCLENCFVGRNGRVGELQVPPLEQMNPTNLVIIVA